MNVYLWNFTKKKKSTKIPATTPTPVDVKLKDMVDIEHPRFILKKSTLGSNNYMKTTFYDGKERYYFLTDVEDGYFDQVIASFEEDYLATWGCGQENGERAFVSRCGSVAMERTFGQPRLKDEFRQYTGEVTNIKKYINVDDVTDPNNPTDRILLPINDPSSSGLDHRLFLIGMNCTEKGLYDADNPDTPDTSKYNSSLELNGYGLGAGFFLPINAFAVSGNKAYYLVTEATLRTFANDLLDYAIHTNIKGSKWEEFLETVGIDVIVTPFDYRAETGPRYYVGSAYDNSSPVEIYERTVWVALKQGIKWIDPDNSTEVGFWLTVFSRTADAASWSNTNYVPLVDNNGCDKKLCYANLDLPMRNEGIINAGTGGTSYREYITMPPYSNFTLRVPMWGTLEIPMEKVYDAEPVDGDYYNYRTPRYKKRVILRWDMDWIKGFAYIGLYNTDGTFICGDMKQCCYRMSIQVNYDDTGLAHTMFNLVTAGLSLVTPLAGLANAMQVAHSTPQPQLMTPPQGAPKEMIARYQKENDNAMKPYIKAQENVDNELHNVVNYGVNLPHALSGFLNNGPNNASAICTQSDLDMWVDNEPYIIIQRNEMLPIAYEFFGVPVEKVVTFYDLGQPSKAGFWVYKNYNPKRYGTLHERDMLKAICEGGFWVE